MDNEAHGRWEAAITRKQIGMRMQGRRRELGLSQQELADRAGTSQNRIYLIEKGDANLTLETLQRLAEILRLDLDIDLLDAPEGDEPMAQAIGSSRTQQAGSALRYKKFAMGLRPCCVWDHNLDQRNLGYLDSLDPGYFDYLASVNGAQLDSDSRDTRGYAALALRVAYDHALETFFALLFAGLQAPDSVVGWMHRYQIHSLRDLVRSVDGRRHPYLKIVPKPYTWEGLAAKMLPATPDNARVQELFAGLWRRLAGDFLDQERIDELNSIKHGLGVGPLTSGYGISLGLDEAPEDTGPHERPHGSDGELRSSYFVARGFGVRPPRPSRSDPHFRVMHSTLYWKAEGHRLALGLISCSVHNVIAHLKAINGADTVPQIKTPQNEETFRAPWQRKPGPRVSELDTVVFTEEVRRFGPDEILEAYDQGSENPGGRR